MNVHAWIVVHGVIKRPEQRTRGKQLGYRGVEIDPRVADGERSVVLDQVEAGVAVRMALLYLFAAEAGAKVEA